MKKILLYLLSLLLLVSTLLTGCTDPADEPEADTRIKLVENGQSAYTLVYPKNASPTVKSAMQRMVDSISDATGVTLEVKTDEIKRGEVYDSNTLEILFGRTGYEETKEVLDGLQDVQFAIRQVGNKLVFTSPRDANLDAMVTYFCEELIEANLETQADGSKILYFTEYTSEGESLETDDEGKVIKNVTVGTAKLSDYVIVYDSDVAGTVAVASDLRSSIETQYGFRLPLYSDTHYAATDGPELLVGKTNRTLSTELYASKSPKLMTFEVVLRGNKLQMLAGGAFSLRQCSTQLMAYIESLDKDGEYLFTDLAPNTAALAQGADLRVMTSNVLAARWGERIKDSDPLQALCPVTVERAEIFAAMLVDYQPDVIGLQEACDVWQDSLPYFLDILKKDYGLEYTWLYNQYNGQMSMTSILYRSDKLEVVESDFQPLSYWASTGNNYYIRTFAWARFRERSTVKEFIMINTHWELSERIEKVQMCINEEVALINSLKAKYNLPIVCTGDFNSKQDTDDYYRFMSEAGVAEMRIVARDNNGLINKAGGCGMVGTLRNANSGNYIDHIYGTSECNALRYETLITNYIYCMTDHSPQIADIQWTK